MRLGNSTCGSIIGQLVELCSISDSCCKLPVFPHALQFPLLVEKATVHVIMIACIVKSFRPMHFRLSETWRFVLKSSSKSNRN